MRQQAFAQNGAVAVQAQERARDILLKAWTGGKTSHAYLFRGPTGVGKRDMALAFAALLNCQNRRSSESCGQCPSCKKLASANHPDFIEIIPDGKLIKIDQIRELKKVLSYPPLEAKTRIIFIADIHEVMARAEVANSLLKTLEEPPADTIFILTVDEAAEILPTISSRCQVVPFYALPVEIIKRQLMKRGVDAATAHTMALISEGSLGRAEALAAEDLLGLRRQIVEELSRLDIKQPECVTIVFDLAASCAKLAHLADLLDLMELWIRDLMLLSATGPESVVLNRDLMYLYADSRKHWNMEELSDKLRLIAQAKKELLSNCNKTAVCEVLFFALLGPV
ncbi:MAG: DNA polymerase III subunit delta' [Deltaproteobacteria bacterium]|nr:DNA polymerase III subunit delta' [Deltaproteobacteria bacterium]